MTTSASWPGPSIGGRAICATLAAAVSHEFKTPLAGIAGAVELLQDHGETMSPDDRRRFLDNAAADTARLSLLVTRLLDLARADMARPEADVAADVIGPLAAPPTPPSAKAFGSSCARPDAPPRAAVPEPTLDTVLNVLFQNSRQAGAAARSS
ncbi:histidine kinase dimerization/phospho-acceptor domain-containing protein [Caulobacter segnis]